jgi:hypothetical protein
VTKPVTLHGDARLAPHQRDLMCRRVREDGLGGRGGGWMFGADHVSLVGPH